MKVCEVMKRIVVPPPKPKPEKPMKRVDTSYTRPSKAQPFNKPKSKHLS